MGANTLYLSPLLFLLSMMVVGGVGNLWGPLLGAAALMLTDEVLKDDIGEVLAQDLQRIGGYIFAAFPVADSDRADYMVRKPTSAPGPRAGEWRPGLAGVGRKAKHPSRGGRPFHPWQGDGAR